MPMDHALRRHLEALTTEVFTGVAESEARYKAELVGQALQRNNAGGMLLPYKDAELHALTTRFEQVSTRYLEALDNWGVAIDASIEREMIQEFEKLTVGPSALTFPPAVDRSTAQAVQTAYAKERESVARLLLCIATNKLTELKMRAKRPVQDARPTTIYNAPVFNAPVENAYINSPHNEIRSVHLQITADLLQKIKAISKGDAQLEAAASEISAAQSKKQSMLDKVQKWARLLQSSGT